MAHRDESNRLYIYTDSSDWNWSGITQVTREQLSSPHCNHGHDPSDLNSCMFNDTKRGWSTLEKGAFSVLASTEFSHWIAACPDEFDLFTGQKMFIFIFDQFSITPDKQQEYLRKVLLWAVRISAYNLICFLINGEDKICADLLTICRIKLVCDETKT